MVKFTGTNLLKMVATVMVIMQASTSSSGERGKPLKICRGTSSGLSHTGSWSTRLANYRQRYENCTVVNGNLEIVHLATNDELDLSFLEDIQEVTGYVLIHSNTVTKLHLNKLRIIRGTSLYNCDLPGPSDRDRMCSLVVASNYHARDARWSLRQLEFVSLQDILTGNVKIADNESLCFGDSVNWRDIFSSNKSQAFVSSSGKCAKICHESCEFNGKRYCWGEGPDMCQKMTKEACSPQCDNRCSGPTPDLCCHKECAVGCTGPSNTDCLACRQFENEGRCEDHCPPITIYDPLTFVQVHNPNGRYTYGSTCLKRCPAHLSTDNGACVKQCSPGNYILNGSCVPCSGHCPKSCQGTGEMGITSADLSRFKDCKIIHGNLLILRTAFMHDTGGSGTSPIAPDQLEVLSSVEEISGSLGVEGLPADVEDLSFLRNLKIIRGIELTNDLKSLKIVASNLTSLGLHSLFEISYGNVHVVKNRRLCFAESVDWSHLFRDPDSIAVVRDNNPDCGSATCSDQCSDLGCWGQGETRCISCRNFRFGNRCLPSCVMDPPAFEKDNSTCERCHSECTESCTGDKPDQCKSCLNVRDGDTCISECPIGKYPDSDGNCQPCHDNCYGYGCSGPLNTVGEGGCLSCDMVIYGDEKNQTKVTGCLDPKSSQCPEGFFKVSLHGYPESHSLHMKYGCKKCHPECVTCDEYGTNYCGLCRHFRQEEKCVPFCMPGFYLEVQSTPSTPSPSTHALGRRKEQSCRSCNDNCLTCHGPEPTECHTCRNYLIYLDDGDHSKGFNCTDKCPEIAPFKVAREENGTKITLCVADDNPRHLVAIVIPVVVIVAVAGIVLAVVVFKFKKAKDRSRVLTAAASLLAGKPMPASNSSGEAGDTSRVETISEKELRLGEKIGSGAFGSVFKGVWSPQRANCRIYVAIKIAHNCFGSQTDEILNEVRIMSSVVNEHCIRILGFCLASRIMIITQLMPYGCMLEFIQKYKDNIGSKVLLNWAMQIAKGMHYLESVKIVHRDLAARNVLVQNDNHVRITDFGLSKMLRGTDQFVSEGGKLPIKWLALESLLTKCFTHQSDVWSYGVTLWEMFTFGKKPYEHVEPCNMVDFLEKGDRLAQPAICTIDVYMVMIKCWVPNAGDRPTFSDLVKIFEVMARDPVRFLVITNDESKELKSTEPLAMLRQLSTIDDEKPVIAAEDYLNMSAEPEGRDPGPSRAVKFTPRFSPIPSRSRGGPSNVVLSPKKANGHVPSEIKNKADPNSTRYIEDPCDTDQRPVRRPVKLPAALTRSRSSASTDEQDYLEPQKTPNGFPLGPKSPLTTHAAQQAFSNPTYFDLPQIPLLSVSSLTNHRLGSVGRNVLFVNSKAVEPCASLVGRESDSTNDVFDDDPGPTSFLLGLAKDNNNEYYNHVLGANKKSGNDKNHNNNNNNNNNGNNNSNATTLLGV